jgi:hypothetical protein
VLCIVHSFSAQRVDFGSASRRANAVVRASRGYAHIAVKSSQMRLVRATATEAHDATAQSVVSHSCN